jgi:Abnormal spindle-like microcephaly-assoc'd, ASPM-SPD-2-Hydin
MQGALRALKVALASLLVVAPGLGLIGSAEAASSYQLRFSSSATRSSAHVVTGAVLAGPSYVFVGPSSRVSRVSFWVDDPHRLRAPRHTDTRAPFDLVGGTKTKATPWYTSGLREGTHHLTALLTTSGGKRIVLQAAFTVRNTPNAPIGSRAEPADHRVKIVWHSAGGTTAGFNVYRSTTTPVSRKTPLNAKPLKATATQFVDLAALNGTTYNYVVVAVSAHGLMSKPSLTLRARPSASPPPPPKAVQATAASAQIVVKWVSGGGTTDGFDVYRSTLKNVPLTNPINLSPVDATTYTDPVQTPGTYFYVVQAISADGVRSGPSDTAEATFGGADIRVSPQNLVLYASRGKTVTGTVNVTNVGNAPLDVSGAALSSDTPLSLAPVSAVTLGGGQSQALTITFTPTTDGPQRATLDVISDDPDTPDAAVGIGGLAIDDAVNSEPSLQWIIDAYGINANDGDPKPQTYALDATPPAGGIVVTGFKQHDQTKPVQVTALAAFVNPATSTDATADPTWGWAPQNMPNQTIDSYRIRRGFIGTTYTIPTTGKFAVWATLERKTRSTSTNSLTGLRFIAFPTDTPGTYVLADDTNGQATDDWNDLPFLVQNVDVATG